MKEFNYDLDYKSLDFTNEETRELYRIGRGEQGVLLVRPYTDDICALFDMYLDYLEEKDFIGMDMCRKFLEMGFTRSRRYANHHTGKKYDDEGNVRPQEPDHATCIFKRVRDMVAKNDIYVTMRKQWRASE